MKNNTYNLSNKYPILLQIQSSSMEILSYIDNNPDMVILKSHVFRDIDVSYVYSMHLINVLSECGFVEYDMIDKRSKRVMITDRGKRILMIWYSLIKEFNSGFTKKSMLPEKNLEKISGKIVKKRGERPSKK